MSSPVSETLLKLVSGVGSYNGWKIKCLLRSVCLRLNLKLSTFGESTRSAGSEFQIGTMRMENNFFRMLVLGILLYYSVLLTELDIYFMSVSFAELVTH